MQLHAKSLHSARVLGAGLAAATVLVPTLLAALMPARVDALVIVALMLPLLAMGVLDAALPHDGEHAS